MRLAVCQFYSPETDPVKRTDLMIGMLDSEDADMYVFPEMSLTGYFHGDCSGSVPGCLDRIEKEAERRKVCVVFGGPEYSEGKEWNCAYAFSESCYAVYRKIHLPGFGQFREDRMYAAGTEPVVFDYRGFRFGLTVCYDAFFPEQFKWAGLRGADANICISASPASSRSAFEKVLPARAIENTSYLVFVNNVGPSCGTEFFGGSRVLSPLGDPIVSVDGTGTAVAVLESDAIVSARLVRPVLKDTVTLK